MFLENHIFEKNKKSDLNLANSKREETTLLLEIPTLLFGWWSLLVPWAPGPGANLSEMCEKDSFQRRYVSLYLRIYGICIVYSMYLISIVYVL